MAKRTEPGGDPDGAAEIEQSGRLVPAARDDGDLGDPQFGQADERRGRGAAGAQDDRVPQVGGAWPSAPATPSMSVLSARQPWSVRTRVLAEPTSSARSVRSSANCRAANLPGIVTDTPTHSGPKPPTSAGSCSAVHSMRS